ncbi:MAG: RagB/SusD family nutrient uptake outer membrane protein [Bacteroidales bacterium]|nr:RagB/SusD family nutrient uptake outer membrane protein [Bacteroidales bacterium]
MKNYIKISVVAVVSIIMSLTSCISDLDTVPLDDDIITSANVYQSAANYKRVLAKVYAGLAVSGQQGPHGANDLSGLDEGFGQYHRAYWYAQELPTDETILSWNDGNLRDYQEMDWSPSNEFITNMYSRIFYQISICNEFIRECADSKLDERGFSDAEKETIKGYKAEARMMRALAYYHALDMFGNVPFVTEEDGVGSFLPEQISRADLYDYIESELLEIQDQLPPALTNDYGRFDQAAAWTLLAKLYLNAEVYTGTANYDGVITNCQNVINAGFELHDSYPELFLADNHNCDGVIFAIPQDGQATKTWGGTTFLVCATVGGTIVPADFGVGEAWNGLRTLREFVAVFPDITGATDKRAMIWTDGQTLDIEDQFEPSEGYRLTKWKNITSEGVAGSHSTHPDTDIPFFRLADVYLMYAEAHLRGATNASAANALDYVNLVRNRAYEGPAGEITAGQLTLDWILDERGREFHYEGYRRTDLIRFGLFTGGGYLWQFKGAAKDGIATDDKYNLFPIPDSDRGANPNLEQNPGYGEN